MLSTETKSCSSSDPTQLKDCSSDEKTTSQKLDSSQQHLNLHKKVVDPFQELDHQQLQQTPLLKFSLREYVFNARRKDIKTNWPFSPKTLQHCLKHGVKDILPPFQGLDSEKSQSSRTCGTWRKESVKAGSSKEEASKPYDEILEDLTDNVHLKSSNKNESLSTKTHVSKSKIELVNTIRRSSTSVESDTLLEVSAKVGAAAVDPHSSRKSENLACVPVDPRLSRKSENSARVPGKKSKLIVKVGGNPDRSSTENTGRNTNTGSETMASKVCPVCKTFSSSSNTTLNAHIDQCLSGEPTSKWFMDSKLPRQRNKPPKIKSMVDIYETAKPCTLEELHKRNGIDWASEPSLPVETTKISDEGQKHSVPVVRNKSTTEVGDVYIDSSGTKLRILSKLNDPPSCSKVGEDSGPKRSFKEGKGTKFRLSKKEKKHAQNKKKYLKVAPQNKKMCSRITNNSLVLRSGERMPEAEGNTQIDAVNSMFPHLGALRQWACSKRTGLTRKCNVESSQETSGGKLHVAPDDDAEDIAFTRKTRKPRSTNMYEKTISASEYNVRSPTKLRKTRANDMEDQPHGVKEIRHSSSISRMGDSTIRSLSPPKRKARQFSKECSSIGDSHISKTLNIIGSRMHGSRIGVATDHAGHSRFPDVSCNSRLQPTKISSMVTNDKASTLRRTMPGTGWSSSIKSKSNLMKKRSTLKKSRVNCMADVDEDMASNLEIRKRGNQYESEDYITNSILGGPVTKLRDQRPADISLRGKGALKDLLHSYPSNIDKKAIISSAGAEEALMEAGGYSHKDGYQIHNFVHESSSGIATAQHTLHMCKSSRCEHHRLETESSSMRTIGDYEGPSYEAAGIELGEREMFSSDGGFDSLRQPNVRVMEELVSLYGIGHSNLQVDPIPIPGPPGSFLPSPGRTGLEDFHGNSSFSASRGQSSRDLYDVADGDLSDSPKSAISSVSNLVAGGSGAKSYVDKFKPAGSIGFHENEYSGFSSAGNEPSSDNFATVQQSVSAGTEKITKEGNNEFQNRSVEKIALEYRKDDQPCCCQRKDRMFDNITLHCEEQLLRKQIMSSLGVDMSGKLLGGESYSYPNNLEARPETVQMTNCSSSGSENVFLPINAAANLASFRGSPDADMGLSCHSESEPASQPGPNPVLRLMGKNLMVVNKDPKTEFLGQAETPSSRLISEYPATSGISPSLYQIKGQNSSPHVGLYGTVISSQETHGTVGQCSEVELSCSSSIQTNVRNLEILGQPLGGIFENQFSNGSFAPLLEPFVYRRECHLSAEENRHDNRLTAASSYALEKAPTSFSNKHENAVSNAKQREIIVIDDNPEIGAPLSTNVMRSTENLKVSQGFSSQASVSTPHCMSHVDIFPYNHLKDSIIPSNSPVSHCTSSNATHTETAKGPVRWSYTSEGFGMFQMSSFAAGPSSLGQRQPPLHYTSRLS